jgi:hypothetical protein
MRWLCALVLLASVVSSPLGASSEAITHLRIQDSRTASAFRDGLIRSPTLRKLVDQIEASNMFVYVSLNPFMKKRLAGQTTWMGKSKEFRYLRVAINGDLVADQIIGTLGHELRHVVEVIDDESVVDEGTLVSLYRRIGKPSSPDIPSGWETVAAQDAGLQVRRELRTATAVADDRSSLFLSKS